MDKNMEARWENTKGTTVHRTVVAADTEIAEANNILLRRRIELANEDLKESEDE